MVPAREKILVEQRLIILYLQRNVFIITCKVLFIQIIMVATVILYSVY